MICSTIKKVAHLVALLKAYDIHNVVLSPGNRNVPIVHTVESDPFFKTYCITDERSAGFFALGMIEKLDAPVAICCTSGTAVANYVSAVSEAYYQKLPLLVITADRNPAYLNQREDQMIPQVDILRSVCKKSVSLPIAEDDKSLIYSNRLLNEAFLELNHHGSGPIHINIPFEAGIDTFIDMSDEKHRVIQRHNIFDRSTWNEKIKQLSVSSNILVIYGQSNPLNLQQTAIIEKFAKKYNCAFAVDHLSNYHGYGSVYAFYASKIMTSDMFSKVAPDIVISVNGNYTSYIRGLLKSQTQPFAHWLVCEDGNVADPFSSLTDIFECSALEFFNICSEYGESTASHSYLEKWLSQPQNIDDNTVPFSDVYAVQSLMKNIPEKSLLHLGNSTSVRLAQHFSLNETVEVYCNRGTNGIDGSMSSFVGQASLHNELSFLIIGDLSFFYDMNALWNRYVGENVRILLNNNSGATLFHHIIGLEKIPTLNNVTSAEHNATAKGWAQSLGIRYLCAQNKEEFDEMLQIFTDANVKEPIVFEVLTSKEEDAKILKQIYHIDRSETTKDKFKKLIKNILK